MFRDCFFKYADISSEIYNLKLYYTSESIENLNSGGEYDLNIESLPKSVEQLLYGINYSEKPLEFDIEIVNTEKAIPQHQIIEIKDWLFGQDGWKPLYVLDENQDYHLKCLLIPKEDIVDGLGIRGFKCTLRNISGFWYGKDKVFKITQEQLNTNKQESQYIVGSEDKDALYWSCFEVEVPHDSMVNLNYITPRIKVTTSDTDNFLSNQESDFDIGVANYNSIADFISAYEQKQVAGQKGQYPSIYQQDINSAISLDIADMLPSSTFTIDTKYIECTDETNPDRYEKLTIGKRAFNLSYGKNICYVLNPENVSQIEIIYTPRYRIGAF